jgi:ribonuclease HI
MDRVVEHRWHRDFSSLIGDGKDTPDKEGLLCYTDGSGLGYASGAGLAVYLDKDPNSIKTEAEYTGMATVFQAELYAMQMACDYAKLRADCKVTILSDSQAAIQAVMHPLILSQTVLFTVDYLNSLASLGKEVLIRWVRGHNNTDGNELANFMAKTGAALEASGPEPFLPTSKATAKQAVKENSLDLWTSKWLRQIIYRQTKIFFPIPNFPTSCNLMWSSCENLRVPIQHLTGHSRLNYHQSLQQPGLSPTCRLCGEAPEESQHIIRSCPALSSTRLACMWQITITDTWEIQGLLNFLTMPQVARLANGDPIGPPITPNLSPNASFTAPPYGSPNAPNPALPGSSHSTEHLLSQTSSTSSSDYEPREP